MVHMMQARSPGWPANYYALNVAVGRLKERLGTK